MIGREREGVYRDLPKESIDCPSTGGHTKRQGSRGKVLYVVHYGARSVLDAHMQA